MHAFIPPNIEKHVEYADEPIEHMPLSICVRRVVLGPQHSMLLGMCGDVYACGRNDDGRLGTGDRLSRKRFTPVPLPSGVRAASLSLAHHSLMLTDDNRVFGCGHNLCGVLASTEHSKCALFFTELPVPPDIRVTSVQALKWSSVVTSSEGHLYSTGDERKLSQPFSSKFIPLQSQPRDASPVQSIDGDVAIGLYVIDGVPLCVRPGTTVSVSPPAWTSHYRACVTKAGEVIVWSVDGQMASRTFDSEVVELCGSYSLVVVLTRTGDAFCFEDAGKTWRHLCTDTKQISVGGEASSFLRKDGTVWMYGQFMYHMHGLERQRCCKGFPQQVVETRRLFWACDVHCYTPLSIRNAVQSFYTVREVITTPVHCLPAELMELICSYIPIDYSATRRRKRRWGEMPVEAE